MEEEVRLVVELDADLKYQFRLKTIKEKTNMKEEVIKFIKEYIK